MSDLIQLVYLSSAAQPMSDEELVALLEKSREKNARLGLTGLLLYKGGNFLQVLEGERDAVMGQYQTIQADESHYQIMTVSSRAITERDFPDWKMAFVNLEKVNADELRSGRKWLTRCDKMCAGENEAKRKATDRHGLNG
jgi:hypothetical protein